MGVVCVCPVKSFPCIWGNLVPNERWHRVSVQLLWLVWGCKLTFRLENGLFSNSFFIELPCCLLQVWLCLLSSAELFDTFFVRPCGYENVGLNRMEQYAYRYKCMYALRHTQALANEWERKKWNKNTCAYPHGGTVVTAGLLLEYFQAGIGRRVRMSYSLEHCAALWAHFGWPVQPGGHVCV